MNNERGEWREFNVNDTVRVKITEVGLAEYKRQAILLRGQMPPNARATIRLTPVLDADGYWTVQLWELMQQLGHLCGNGFDLPFETTILLREDRT